MKRKYSRRVVLRYALLQLPGFAAALAVAFLLRRWISFPDSYVWVALSLWIIKDAVLFPFVWTAYDWDDPGRLGSMVGRRGQAMKKMDPSGYVQIGGEIWSAEASDPSAAIEEGEWVTVEDLDGLKLIVHPSDSVP